VVALAVTVAADNKKMGMMSETIEGGTSQEIIGKDLAPLFKGTVTCDDQRTFFITLSNDLVEILGSLGRNGLQAKVIQEQQIASQDASE